MDYGAKVSTPGQDVFTTSSENLMLDSRRNSLKVLEPLSTTIVVSGGTGTTNVAHGLSFRPVVIPFIDFGGNFYILPWTDYYTSGGSADVRVNTTNIKFSVSGLPDATYTIYYFMSETESAA